MRRISRKKYRKQFVIFDQEILTQCNTVTSKKLCWVQQKKLDEFFCTGYKIQEK